MSPELLRNEEPTAACDVYAFGILLFEIVSRQDPFDGKMIVVKPLFFLLANTFDRDAVDRRFLVTQVS